MRITLALRNQCLPSTTTAPAFLTCGVSHTSTQLMLAPTLSRDSLIVIYLLLIQSLEFSSSQKSVAAASETMPSKSQGMVAPHPCSSWNVTSPNSGLYLAYTNCPTNHFSRSCVYAFKNCTLSSSWSCVCNKGLASQMVSSAYIRHRCIRWSSSLGKALILLRSGKICGTLGSFN